MCTRCISPDQADIERTWHIGRHNQPKLAREVFPRALSVPAPRRGGGLDLVVGIWGPSVLVANARPEIRNVQLPVRGSRGQANLPRCLAQWPALHHPGAVVR